ncbi:PREDICTED: uncharacterized protein LOC108760188 [Trachymyrmex cornetzi]|uniref:uncharacterized protein LOC108760188 n=1 Tax=Trachymyrmex cornetzi TaxID=471704 RepID=UPI00084F5734|nr:PREDICTED: uncharacterized protein LOC108760188 [Trachymyrmex cornetzi]
MNTSQSHHLLITSEYLIDQEKYLYWILLHMYGELCIVAAIMLATGSMFISYLLHTCGMFRIASYRINHAVNINILQNITLKNKVFMTESIICAIDIHRQAMKLSKHLVSSFEITMLCFTGGIVVSFTLNLYRCTIINYTSRAQCYVKSNIVDTVNNKELFW